jgi:hypothetical protein
MGYIVRIDKPKNSPKGTHGWQVRVHRDEPKKYHSKLFSDKVHGGREEALAAAEAYLEQYLAEHPGLSSPQPANQPYHTGKLMKNNRSGINGVFKSCTYHGWDKKKEHKAWYWAAFCPVGPDGERFMKRFYIGTHGEEVARRLAIKFRQRWEEAMDKGEAAVAEFYQREHYDKIPDTRFGSDYWKSE